MVSSYWLRWSVVALMATMVACGDDDAEISSTDRVEGSGTTVTDAREVAEFDRIDLRGEGTVLVGSGDNGVVNIETDDNIAPLITVAVRGGELIIETETGHDIEPTDDVVYRIGCPALTGVSLHGAGTISVGDCLSESDASIALAGAGTITVDDVTLGSVDVELSGAGTVQLTGSSDEIDANLTGTGTIDGDGLRTETARATMAGTGEITIWSTGQLDAELSGVGSIYYRGDPEVNTNLTGSGEIEPQR